MPKRVAFLASGDELLAGRTLDTNGRFLAHELELRGHSVIEKRIVGDSIPVIVKALHDLAETADFIVVSGGLGPTPDDLTRESIAEWSGASLEFREDEWAVLLEKFRFRSRSVSENNRKQALFPVGSTVIPNRHGSACGICLVHSGVTVLCLPGVPSEFEEMFHDTVFAEHFGDEPRSQHFIHLLNVSEGHVSQKITDENLIPDFVEWGTQSSPSALSIRLRFSGQDAEAWWKVLQEQLSSHFSDSVFGYDEDTIFGVLQRDCISSGLTVSVAESCTGGYLGTQLTALPGSSNYFIGGIISYSNDVKVDKLSVPQEILDYDGAVSAAVARVMAMEVREWLDTDLSASITGIAGPGGGTAEKPVGLVYIGTMKRHEGPRALKTLTIGSRESIRMRAAAQAAWLMFLRLHDRETPDDN